MACYSPSRVYKLNNELTKNGKKVYVFNISEARGKDYEVEDLACGQCRGCRIDQSRDWALRCMLEGSLYEMNTFITLTYDEEHVNKRTWKKCYHCTHTYETGLECGNGSLCKKDFQLFMKNLRREYLGKDIILDEKGKEIRPIRFFHCGEYGSKCRDCGQSKDDCSCSVFVEVPGRPHHHAVLFNFDFIDKYPWVVRNGIQTYRSDSLESLWNYKGNCEIGSLTWESAGYIARYVTKKINGARAAEHYMDFDEKGDPYYIFPEYITMSRRPGIAKRWFDKYYDDVYNKDYLVLDGRKFRAPKYFDKELEKLDPQRYEIIKAERKERSDGLEKDDFLRRAVKKHIKERQTDRLTRSL